jgi:NAD(P)-dependent dehydrogenase (short-subunit alcohol dehydrogenase family)
MSPFSFDTSRSVLPAATAPAEIASLYYAWSQVGRLPSLANLLCNYRSLDAPGHLFESFLELAMRVLVVGATGLLGREIVKLLSSKHDVIEASRQKAEVTVDLSDKASIVAMYSSVGTVDAVICVGGAARFAPFESLTDGDFAFSLANKLMGQVNLVRYGVGHISKGGSVTLTSGVLAQLPMVGSAAVSVVNAGVEAFVRSAALELNGTLRVNAISPGWVAETLASMGKNPADGIPAADVAKAYERSLMEDLTGQVIGAAK